MIQKSIYATGLTGYIGRNILPLLLSQYKYVLNFRRNNKVYIISRNGTSPLKDLNLIKTKYKSKFFFHLATNYNPYPRNNNEISDLINSNINFPISLFKYFDFDDDFTLIHTSSYIQLLEDNMQNEYSKSKKIFIDYSNSFFKKTINFYLFDSFGIHDPRKKVVDVFIHQIANDLPISIPSNRIDINLSNVNDIAYSIVNNYRNITKGNYLIQSKNNLSLEELAKRLFKLMNKEVSIIRLDKKINYIKYIKPKLKNIYEQEKFLSFQDQLINQIKSHKKY